MPFFAHASAKGCHAWPPNAFLCMEMRVQGHPTVVGDIGQPPFLDLFFSQMVNAEEGEGDMSYLGGQKVICHSWWRTCAAMRRR
uniref:Uncharacterized protein n=1 Tax=Panagrellus redivivus TaxID=6233 RepID=A0A7E4V587_PANRE